jgi:Uma2 family endonuclease
MAATAQVARVPVEVYLNSSYEPDAEYVDGVIEARPMGEWNHADWQAAILEFFRSRRYEWNIRAAAELRIQVTAGNFRVPDVTVTDRSLPVEQVITHPPIAVFEILSAGGHSHSHDGEVGRVRADGHPDYSDSRSQRGALSASRGAAGAAANERIRSSRQRLPF